MLGTLGAFRYSKYKTKAQYVLILIESGSQAASLTWKLFDWNFMFGQFLAGDGERVIKSYALLNF